MEHRWNGRDSTRLVTYRTADDSIPYDHSLKQVSARVAAGDAPVFVWYRAVLPPWNTTKQPLGNNGDHSVFVAEDEGGEWKVTHLEFEEWVVGDGWVNPYELGPIPVGVTTKNLYIANCTASNGTIDYFKYDPDGDHSLAHPSISFTIVDPEPEKYTVVMRYRQTMGEGTWNWDAGGWSWYKADLGDNLNVTLNLTAPGEDGKCLNPNEHEWGTYTYDLLVMKYTGDTPAWVQGSAVDWNFLKRYRDGYHLWVPPNLPSPHGDQPGHDLWTEVPEEEDAQLRGYYALESNWTSAQEAQVRRGMDAEIVVLDPELNERSQTRGPGDVATLGAGYGTHDEPGVELEGLTLYTYQDDDPAGTWRGIFMANDNGGIHSPQWRTHTPLRMITANAATLEAWARYIYKYGDPLVGHAGVGPTAPRGYGQGVWVFGWYPAQSPDGLPVPGLLKMRFVPPGENPLQQQREHDDLRRAYELESTPRGSAFVWQNVRSNWIADAAFPKFINAFLHNTEEVDFSDTEVSKQWSLYYVPGLAYNCAHFAAINAQLNPNLTVWPLLNPETLANHVVRCHDNRWRFYLRGRYFHGTERLCDCAPCQEKKGRK